MNGGDTKAVQQILSSTNIYKILHINIPDIRCIYFHRQLNKLHLFDGMKMGCFNKYINVSLIQSLFRISDNVQ